MDAIAKPVGEALRSALLGLWAPVVLLLVPAGLVPGGSWLWVRGLAFVGVFGAILLIGNLALAIHRPAHFGVRQQGVVAARGKGQPLIDAIGAAGRWRTVRPGWCSFRSTSSACICSRRRTSGFRRRAGWRW
jgi:hypothetical protein